MWVISQDGTSKKCTITNMAASTETLAWGTANTAKPCTPIGSFSDGNTVYVVTTGEEASDVVGTAAAFSASVTNPLGTAAATGQVVKLTIPATGNPTIAKWSWMAKKATTVDALTPTGIFQCGANVAVAVTTVANDKIPTTGSTAANIDTTNVQATGTSATLILSTDLVYAAPYQGTAAATDAQCALVDLTGVGAVTVGTDTYTLGWKGVDSTTKNCYIKKGSTKTDLLTATGKKCNPVALYVSGTDVWGLVNINDAVAALATDATTGVQQPTYPATIANTIPTAFVFRWDGTAAKAAKGSFIVTNTAANVMSFFNGNELTWCNGNVVVKGVTHGTDAKLPGVAATNVFASTVAGKDGVVALSGTTLLIAGTSNAIATLPTVCTFNALATDITEATVAWNVGHTQEGTVYRNCYVKRGTTNVNMQTTSGKHCQAIGLYVDGANIYALFNTDNALDAAALAATTAFTGAPWETIPTGVTTPTAVVVKIQPADGKVSDGTYLGGKTAAAANAAWTGSAIGACSTTHIKVTGTAGTGTNVGPGKAATNAAWVAGLTGSSQLALARDLNKIDEVLASTATLTTCASSSDDDSGDDTGDDEESAGVLAIANAALAFLGLVYMF
jgi:hypothetical protein